jgi:DNA-binding NarL/FixJ family response regulator
VVDDYEPFRRFICSTLRKRPEFHIIGEISDGLNAVHKADELRPDLIVLDIGLPTLNGIEAAHRIRKLAPESKILFVSQESSADVVHEALALGALGYVVKAHAGSELLAAVEAILQNRQFIGSGLSGHYFNTLSDSKTIEHFNEPLPLPASGKAKIHPSHDIEFYSDDAAFVVGFTRFIEATLGAGNAVIVVATESHRESFLHRLQDHGIDIVAAIQKGHYLSLDVTETLSAFMENDLPGPVRFFRVVCDLIAQAAQSTAGEQSKVAICGECASILWAQGKADAAIQVEQFCNQLTRQYEVDILCGCSLSSFYREEDKQVFQKICSEY